MKTTITITDEMTGKSRTEETSQPITEAIRTIAELSKGRICGGDKVKASAEGRLVTYTFATT